MHAPAIRRRTGSGFRRPYRQCRLGHGPIAFIDHIKACNNADLSQFRPFLTAGSRIGWIGDTLAARLAAWPDIFAVRDHSVVLADRLDSFEARCDAMALVLETLAGEGIVQGWRSEAYPVMAEWAEPPMFTMERAACPLFGIRAWGVHLNGYVQQRDGLYLWVAMRARDKQTYPGMLDNTVAGGQPHGIGPRDNMIKECGEEAGIPVALAERMRSVGTLSYCHQSAETVKPDQIFSYDLELPADFVPVNQDGEIDSFELWPIDRVLERVRDSMDFKFNCNLVIIDFLIRHGVLTPENEPDYMALTNGLHQDA